MSHEHESTVSPVTDQCVLTFGQMAKQFYHLIKCSEFTNESPVHNHHNPELILI